MRDLNVAEPDVILHNPPSEWLLRRLIATVNDANVGRVVTNADALIDLRQPSLEYLLVQPKPASSGVLREHVPRR